MATPMLETFLLEQLEAFARIGTVSGAARELCITQPAMSRNLKKIEQEIGVGLFDHKNGRLLLNENGEVAARYARQALDAIGKVAEMTRAFDMSKTSIVLGLSNVTPIKKVTPLLGDLYPEKAVTTVMASESELLGGLGSHRFDLAVLHGKPHADGIRMAALMREHLCISVPKDHQLALRTEVAFADLMGMHIITAAKAGRWIDVCLRHLSSDDLIVQSSITALSELIQSSTLPSFCTDTIDPQVAGLRDRAVIPISDDDASTVYYLACLESEAKRFERLFDVVGSDLRKSS